MKSPFICLFLLLTPIFAGELSIQSPDTAQTFVFGSTKTRSLRWNDKKQLLSAEITFTNESYSDSNNSSTSESFSFALPGIWYDEKSQTFYAKTPQGEVLPVAKRQKKFIGSSIEPTENARIRVQRVRGKVAVILEAVDEGQVQAAKAKGELPKEQSINSLLSH